MLFIKLCLLSISMIYNFYLTSSCHAAHQALSLNNDNLRRKGMKSEENEKQQIQSVLDMIRDEEPFSAYGYFEVNNSTYLSILSQTVSYLVILVSFSNL
ncbi:gustatory and pheromone receptor 32a [Eurytemora carolleeae]|uniref:gustatory and pheromone receptor 32a n=1 Tax=Eurytemora carolleeae TaxID=1294199 RepID=UPI000C7660BD|nr:gustatory and pheromone receptor 32a [Eurytemora carolleeae]|eukprot:XP_023319591.1 gustatory and pheromone receptor 32a-like [Eurytemora affinis]